MSRRGQVSSPAAGHSTSGNWAAAAPEIWRPACVRHDNVRISLESGIRPGLEFAITSVSEPRDIPEQDRRERDRLLDLPLRMMSSALILLRAGGNQLVLFHLTCGRIVDPSGPRTSRPARVACRGAVAARRPGGCRSDLKSLQDRRGADHQGDTSAGLAEGEGPGPGRSSNTRRRGQGSRGAKNRARRQSVQADRPREDQVRPAEVHHPRRDDRQDGGRARLDPVAADRYPRVPLRDQEPRRGRPGAGRRRHADRPLRRRRGRPAGPARRRATTSSRSS